MSMRWKFALLFATTVCLAGCAVSASDIELAPPALDEVRSTTIAGLFDEPVTLTDGRWEGEPYVAGGASRPTAGVAGDLLLTGDLTGDGNDESVAFLWSSAGGSGTRNFFAVFGRESGAVRNIATTLIGDRVQLRSGRIIDGRIELKVVQHGPDDPACCPGTNATRSWSFESGELREAPVQLGGRLAVADLDGYEWQLVGIDRRKAADVPGNVTLQVKGDQVVGQAPCNRYFAAIHDRSAVGEIEIGQVASMRMACPDDQAMPNEQEFLSLLSAVHRFGFITAHLVLTANMDGATRTLHFAPLTNDGE
jgi:heat shock protein HslJ